MCGGRDFAQAAFMAMVLDGIATDRGKPSLLVEGEARGADRHAKAWALRWSVPVCPHPADWQRYGLAAGPIRNREMLDHDNPGLVVAFYDRPVAHSKGTKDMVRAALEREVQVVQITVDRAVHVRQALAS